MRRGVRTPCTLPLDPPLALSQSELDKGMDSKKVHNFVLVDSHKAHFIEQNCRLSLNLLVEA